MIRSLSILAFLTLALLPMSHATPQNPPAPAQALPEKVSSMGTYMDRSGQPHSWSINDAHALIWNNAPYLPVGGSFAPRSFASEDESAWLEDQKALTTLKAAGLLDVLILPGKALHEVAPAALQRLIDYLDANDFRYGLAFGKGISAPLSGTVVRPASYRIADTQGNLSATWPVSDCDYGLYVLTDTGDDNKIVRQALLTTQDGAISASTEVPATVGKTVALLYPHKTLSVHRDGALPDLWSHFDGYRDTVIGYLKQIKLGKGFRFFLDPLTYRMGLTGEADFLIPDSVGFGLEWEGFLRQKYPSFEDAKNSWALTEGNFQSYQELARLLPLWANISGVPYLYDPVTRKPLRILDARQSRWWTDFLQCRNESILYHMNAMADLLKKSIANVPVVYTWTQTHPIFWNTDREGGFDGLAIPARGESLVARSVGPAYSEAEQAARTMWCLATDVAGDGAQPVGGMATEVRVYPSQMALHRDLDTLRRVGLKGFFVDGFQIAPDRADRAVAWLSLSNGLAWLQEYAGRLGQESRAAAYAPSVLFYPQTAPGPGHIGFVPGTDNTLWLNSFYPGEALDWWPAYSGYTIRVSENAEPETVLVSLLGRRETHLWARDIRSIQAFGPDGVTPVPFKKHTKTSIAITLSETPTILRAGGQRLIPQEAAETALFQLSALAQVAIERKVPAADGSRITLARAKDAYKQKDFETAYMLARGALDELTALTAPYIWIEGERPYVHTFGEVAVNYEASNIGFLRLSTPTPAGRHGYAARYLFDVPADGRYNIWLAGTYPDPETSPIKWRINSEPIQDVAAPMPQGPLYLSDRFGWFMLGTVSLKRGESQSLTIYVADKAAASGAYVFSIDALLLTTRSFAPNGPVRPLPIEQKTFTGDRRSK